ncbi:MAG TPA: HEPN domain-containing protein [Candidatus Limnocylindrales bacterium]|nr:HEPN domain-containing protein [Candidatus Limnocylindrales bacterium]
MDNIKMALSYLHGARSRLNTAKSAFSEKDFSYVVRQSQECVELCLKSALRFVGIEPPKWHDVGFIFEKEADRFPDWFKNEIDKLKFISRKLRREREPSMYGDEELDLTPDELYHEYDAKVSLEDAVFVYELCEKLI